MCILYHVKIKLFQYGFNKEMKLSFFIGQAEFRMYFPNVQIMSLPRAVFADGTLHVHLYVVDIILRLWNDLPYTDRWMGSRLQSTAGCFPQLCFLFPWRRCLWGCESNS